MKAKLLDGKILAQKIYSELREKITILGKKPKLVVVLIGDEAESVVFVGQKHKVANQIGVGFELIRASSNISQNELEILIEDLNKDSEVHGIIVQKPLPKQIDSDRIDCLVSSQKDVDGLNPISEFKPATAKAVFALLQSENISVRAKDVVVVGDSRLTGLPTALEFLDQEATVTICHEATVDLVKKTIQADILAVAVGKPKLIKAEMVKDGAVVIDIGISRILNSEGKSRLVGDVDFNEVAQKASYISPVPGGVGAVTVAMVMKNLFQAFQEQQND